MADFIILLASFAIVGTVVLSVAWLVEEGWAWLERSAAERELTFWEWRQSRG